MKNSSLFINWILTGLILFHIPFGHLALEGFVLCINARGYLNIEDHLTQAGCAVNESDIETADTPNTDNNCGDASCVDLPLDSDCTEYLQQNPLKKLLNFNLVGSKIQPLSHPALNPGASKRSLSIFDNLPDPHLHSLSTTILLI